MVAAETEDDLALARAEVRQLRETIDVLRVELEDAAATAAADRQRAAALQDADREQARAGVDAMRDRLETTVIEGDSAVQAALAQSADEVAQLKATVEALRHSLVGAQQEASAHREESERAFRVERDELHETIAVLRTRLEAADAG